MQGGILSATESSKAATTETNFVRISTNKPQFTMADFIFGAVFRALLQSFLFYESNCVFQECLKLLTVEFH